MEHLENEKILRKLSAGELVYDYELKQKCCILPFSLLFDSTHDLFQNKALVDKSIQTWKRLHPFLNAKIVVREDDAHPKFSHERYFAQNENTCESNVTFVKLVTNDPNNNNDSSYNEHWKLLHERELNAEPVGRPNSNLFLWRINLIQLNDSSTTGKHEYCLIFTAHHSITDGRNGFCILRQLLQIIEEHLLATFDARKHEAFERPNESLEEILFHNDPAALSCIKSNPKFEHSPENKMPANFSRRAKQQQLQKSPTSTKYSEYISRQFKITINTTVRY